MVDRLNFKADSEIYPLEKEKANRQTVWEHYFARKIAFLLAPISLKLNISANQISFLSLAAGILGAGLIALGDIWLILLGGTLMQTWLVLDKTDGLVARLTKTSSKFGEFFEELNGSIIAVLFFSSIGIAASKFPGFLPDSFKIHPFLFIIFGILTSLFVVFRHLLNRHFEIVFQSREIIIGFSGRGLLFNLYKTTIKFSGVYSLAQPIFIIAAIFNFLGLYVLAYFLIQGALIAASIIYLTIKAGRSQ